MAVHAAYAKAYDYIKAFAEQFESFFNTFVYKVKDLSRSKIDMIDELQYKKGDSFMNICAKKELLEEVSSFSLQKAQKETTISNMENFFGATISVPVSVEVLNGRKLKKRLGIPLDTADAQSVLILGVAINNKNKYSIILENGAPRISLIATFAHELTHIWQYINWDNKKNFEKCPKDKRLLIYEGMAKWAEIQYLYLIGETNVARREEFITRNRNDEYGIGFCIYEAQYPLTREAMSCDYTPFTPNQYPVD